MACDGLLPVGEEPASPIATEEPLAHGRSNDPLPKGVILHARSLHVPDGALVAAFEAFLSAFRAEGTTPPHGGMSEAAAAKLRMWEGDGMRAVAVLIREDACGDFGPDLVRVVSEPGREEPLIAVANDGGASLEARGIAIECLSVADTARTRDYLVERLGREQDATLSASIATSLGTLHEPRGAETVASWIRTGDRGRLQRASLAYTLADMDRHTARRELSAYLREPECDIPFCVVLAIHGVDPTLARQEAAWVLSDRASLGRCDEQEQSVLRTFAAGDSNQEKD